MRYALLVNMLFFFLANRAQDTLVLTNKTEMIVKVQKVSADIVKYKVWDNIDSPDLRIGVAIVSKIKYHDGKVLVLRSSEDYDYWDKKFNIHYGPAYDALRKKASRCFISGGIFTGIGIPAVVGGYLLQLQGVTAGYSSAVPHSRPGHENTHQVWGGVSLWAFGAACLLSGPIELITAGVYVHKANRIRKGNISFSYPQPDIMLPTAQNNFESGFSIKTGITF